MEKIWIYGKDGTTDACVVLVTRAGVPVIKELGRATKAQAELQAAIAAFECIGVDKDKEKTMIYTDSDIVYGRLTKGWPITSNVSLSWKAKKLFKKVKKLVVLRHIDESENLAMKIITRKI
jgi:ribonuclease HI